jgi:hypothetical protein
VECDEKMIVNGEYARNWKKTVVACLKVLSQHSPGDNEKNQEKPNSWQLARLPPRVQLHLHVQFERVVLHVARESGLCAHVTGVGS